MNENEIDTMDVHHPLQLQRAYHDLDGVDWRLAPHDDRTVFDALEPDPPPTPAPSLASAPAPVPVPARAGEHSPGARRTI